MKRDLSKLKIPMTNKERQRKRRDEMIKAGGCQLSVWLDGQSTEMLNALLDRLPRLNKKRLISEAIKHLHDDLNADVHGDLASKINRR